MQLHYVAVQSTSYKAIFYQKRWEGELPLLHVNP